MQQDILEFLNSICVNYIDFYDFYSAGRYTDPLVALNDYLEQNPETRQNNQAAEELAQELQAEVERALYSIEEITNNVTQIIEEWLETQDITPTQNTSSRNTYRNNNGDPRLRDMRAELDRIIRMTSAEPRPEDSEKKNEESSDDSGVE